MKIYILMVLAGVLILAGLLIDKLSSDAVGMALGVIFGLLAGLPAIMMAAVGRRREPEVVYRDRIIYQIAVMEPEPPQRPTARLADDWLVDCLDSQAQVQLGVTRRQLPERRKVTP
jgi:hypothetical protein